MGCVDIVSHNYKMLTLHIFISLGQVGPVGKVMDWQSSGPWFNSP